MNLKLGYPASHSGMWDGWLGEKRGTIKETGQRKFYILKFMHFVEALERSNIQNNFSRSEGLYVTRILDIQETSTFTESWV